MNSRQLYTGIIADLKTFLDGGGSLGDAMGAIELARAGAEAAAVDKRERKLCKNFAVQESTGKVICRKLKATIGDMCPCGAYEQKKAKS